MWPTENVLVILPKSIFTPVENEKDILYKLLHSRGQIGFQALGLRAVQSCHSFLTVDFIDTHTEWQPCQNSIEV